MTIKAQGIDDKSKDRATDDPAEAEQFPFRNLKTVCVEELDMPDHKSWARALLYLRNDAEPVIKHYDPVPIDEHLGYTLSLVMDLLVTNSPHEVLIWKLLWPFLTKELDDSFDSPGLSLPSRGLSSFLQARSPATIALSKTPFEIFDRARVGRVKVIDWTTCVKDNLFQLHSGNKDLSRFSKHSAQSSPLQSVWIPMCQPPVISDFHDGYV